MYRLLLLTLSLISLSSNAQTINDFSFTDIDGNNYNLYENLEQNKAVGIYFFFVNCSFCQTSTPSLQDYLETVGDDCMDIIALSVDQADTEAQIQNYKDSKAVDYRFFTSAGTDNHVFTLLSQNFGSSVNTPSFLLINPDKTIASQQMGLNEFLNNTESAMSSLVDALDCETSIEKTPWQGLEIKRSAHDSWSVYNPDTKSIEALFFAADGSIQKAQICAPGWNELSLLAPQGIYWLSLRDGRQQFTKALLTY